MSTSVDNTARPIIWIETHCMISCNDCTEVDCSGHTGVGRNYCDEAFNALEKLYDSEKSDLVDKIRVYGHALESVVKDSKRRTKLLHDSAIELGLIEDDGIKHVCGLMGYNPMLGDICPSCEAERK